MQRAAKKEFGKLLKAVRNDRGFTLRQLAESAGMRHPNIAALESGRLSAGPEISEKLANTLHLRDTHKKEFLMQAANTRQNPFLKELAGCPAIIANLLGGYMLRKKIDPNRITNFACLQLPSLFPHMSPSLHVWLAWLDTDVSMGMGLKREISDHLRNHPGEEALLVIFLPKGRQFLLAVNGKEF